MKKVDDNGNKLYGLNLSVSNGNDITKNVLLTLPCQIEKVGSTTDKLYYDTSLKTYVIEKNINTRVLQSSSIATNNWRDNDTTTSCLFKKTDVKLASTSSAGLICKLDIIGYSDLYNYTCGITLVEGYDFGLRVHNDELNGKTLAEYIDESNIEVKYITTNPMIIEVCDELAIPTFDGKTIITFTDDVKPTFKCKVPVKS